MDGDTLLHRWSPQVKIVGLFAFALSVVAVPAPGSVPLCLALLIGALLVLSTRLPWRHVWPRLLLEVPFLLFALLLPFVASGPRISIGPLEVSQPGLVGAWMLAAKGTSAVLAATAFSVTTSARDLVVGLQRLHFPATLVAILSFMVRYAGVVTDELTRMRIARESRGFSARSVRSWPTLGRTMGTLFVRSFERGERVHLAMTSRGWTGSFPSLGSHGAPAQQWLACGIPAVTMLATTLWWTVTR